MYNSWLDAAGALQYCFCPFFLLLKIKIFNFRNRLFTCCLTYPTYEIRSDFGTSSSFDIPVVLTILLDSFNGWKGYVEDMP